MSLAEALEFATATDRGRVREHNEDAVFANPHLGLAILADGMGGYNAGEVASGMATTLLAAELEAALAGRSPSAPAHSEPSARRCLRSCVESVNAAILAVANSQKQCAGMGTTLVAALFYDDRVAVAHLGDSRLYRLRGDQLLSLTRDHSPLQEQLDSGLLTLAEARHSQQRNLLTRALGVDTSVDVEIHEHAVAPGDLYLLCSDGLTEMLDDTQIGRVLQLHGSQPDLAARQLIRIANDNGGHDNVSVILVAVRRGFPAAANSWWSSFAARFRQDRRRAGR
ncbi:Stp1/IreP family PP2C-type Ser/Thr phosphatase [Rhodocyclus tenuis]|uniref:Protein phosphatase n=1 Tax=Rhodocyclus tenuis TaxID=1066 RepID=A0A840FXM7_RHOTE|nr:Stp1/IreP family PP2C-type Ser/Thr phosphatase [Rhodocyclus tenuis]MBB4246867.1 protein phosphatase [Rhodocyclus tenuis]